MTTIEPIRDAIRDIPDFPKEGILFKDITPILSDPNLFQAAVHLFTERYHDERIEKIAAIEARGFLFGAALAHTLHVGLIPIRKQGKLPHATKAVTYDLEYGTATIEMHTDAIRAGERVLLIDDLLATGGTAAAAAKLIEEAGGEVVGPAFLIELSFLEGRKHLEGYEVFAPIVF